MLGGERVYLSHMTSVLFTLANVTLANAQSVELPKGEINAPTSSYFGINGNYGVYTDVVCHLNKANEKY